MLGLGGKDPMIVCSDANLSNAISGCLWGGFANAGQTCSGIERVYVMRRSRIASWRVVEGAKALSVGDPMQWTTEIGPMVSHEQFEKVDDLVRDAVAARRRCAAAACSRCPATTAATSTRPRS